MFGLAKHTSWLAHGQAIKTQISCLFRYGWVNMVKRGFMIFIFYYLHCNRRWKKTKYLNQIIAFKIEIVRTAFIGDVSSIIKISVNVWENVLGGNRLERSVPGQGFLLSCPNEHLRCYVFVVEGLMSEIQKRSKFKKEIIENHSIMHGNVILFIIHIKQNHNFGYIDLFWSPFLFSYVPESIIHN